MNLGPNDGNGAILRETSTRYKIDPNENDEGALRSLHLQKYQDQDAPSALLFHMIDHSLVGMILFFDKNTYYLVCKLVQGTRNGMVYGNNQGGRD